MPSQAGYGRATSAQPGEELRLPIKFLLSTSAGELHSVTSAMDNRGKSRVSGNQGEVGVGVLGKQTDVRLIPRVGPVVMVRMATVLP